jgi:acyl-CoA synthetase (AMP-forming)/AMP-acid ligase II
MNTLDCISRQNALRYPNKQALVMGDYACTWGELDRRVNQIANALLANGLKPGDRIALLLGNCPEFIELYFGIARAGMIAVPVNYRLTPDEAAQILKHAEPALFIGDDQHADTLSSLMDLLPAIKNWWLVGHQQLNDVLSYDAIVTAADDSIMESPASESDTFAIFFTSGTTGLPKGAMVSHLNLEANGYNQIIADGSRQDDINLIATPLYHVGAIFMAITYMMLGCTQIILSQFSPKAWLEAMHNNSITVSLLVPTMINAILNEQDFDKYDLGKLRLIFYGGGPMPNSVLEKALQKMVCGFTQGYGLTETLEATFLVSSDHVLGGNDKQQMRLASAGQEAVGAEVRIVNDSGHDLATGEIGEVLIRSRSVIAGYWRQPDVTAETIKDGWFYTGDLGYLDKDRYLYVVDRKKDIVISGGVNIYTKEVESIIYSHPAVQEAAVIGLQDDEWGEIVAAAVVLHPGEDVAESVLIEYCREKLSSYKKPKKIFFMDELPKNPSGKILKRDLRLNLN